MKTATFKLAKPVAVIAATALLTSCATQAVLHIQSEPQGAYITDASGQLLGIAPVDIAYDVNKKSNVCVETDEFSARWVSGVEETVNPVVLCDPGYAVTTVRRDMSQPGLDEDMEFAAQAEILELQRRETEAAESSAAADWATANAMRDAMFYGPYYRRGYYPYGYYGYPSSGFGFGLNYRFDGRRDYDRDRGYGEVQRLEQPAEQQQSAPPADDAAE